MFARLERRRCGFPHLMGIFTVILVLVGHAQAQIPDLAIKELIAIKGHGDSVNVIAFHPKGNILLSGGDDAQAICWDFEKLLAATPAKRLNSPSATWELNRKKIGERVVSVGFDGSGNCSIASGVTHWGNGFGSETLLFASWRNEPFSLGGAKVEGSYTSVALDATGNYALMGAKNDELRLVQLGLKQGKKGDIQKNFQPWTAPGIPGPVTCVAFHPSNNRQVAAAGQQGWIQLYSVNADGLARVITQETPSHKQGVTGMKFAPNGNTLVTSGKDRIIKIIDVKTGKTSQSWEPVTVTPNQIDIHSQYPLLLVAYDDGIPRIINSETGVIMAELPKHEGPCRTVAFSADGHYAATGGDDHLIRVSDLGMANNKKKKKR